MNQLQQPTVEKTKTMGKWACSDSYKEGDTSMTWPPSKHREGDTSMTWPQRGWHKHDMTTERWHKHDMTTERVTQVSCHHREDDTNVTWPPSKHREGGTSITWPQRGWHKHHMTTERVTQASHVHRGWPKHHMTTIKAQRGWHKHHMSTEGDPSITWPPSKHTEGDRSMTWPQRGWHRYHMSTEGDPSITWPPSNHREGDTSIKAQRGWHKHQSTERVTQASHDHGEDDTSITWPQRGWHKHHMTTIKAQRRWHKDPMTHHQSWRPGRCFLHAAGSVCAARRTDCGSAAAGAVSSCRPCAPASRGPRSLLSQDPWTVPPGQGRCPRCRWCGLMCGPSSNGGRGTRSMCGQAASEVWKKERRVDEDHTMFCL